MTQKLSELTPEQQEIQRAKTKAYKAKYRSSMTSEQKAAEAKRNKEYKEKHKEEIKTWRTGYVEANRERYQHWQWQGRRYHTDTHLFASGFRWLTTGRATLKYATSASNRRNQDVGTGYNRWQLQTQQTSYYAAHTRLHHAKAKKRTGKHSRTTSNANC